MADASFTGDVQLDYCLSHLSAPLRAMLTEAVKTSSKNSRSTGDGAKLNKKESKSVMVALVTL